MIRANRIFWESRTENAGAAALPAQLRRAKLFLEGVGKEHALRQFFNCLVLRNLAKRLVISNEALS